MNVNQLHQQLGMLIAKGHGRKPVSIDASTFNTSMLDDGVVILDVKAVDGPVWIEICDGDGVAQQRADGSNAGAQTIILKGWAA